MEKISIVTGAGSGIGRGIAIKLANEGHKVIGIGRRASKLKETQSFTPANFHILPADVSQEKDRAHIADFIGDSKIHYLVHNAGVIGDITHLENISLEEWRRVMAINVEGPLFLTKQLLSNLTDARILHVSSGAAHFAIEGWGAYCTSKSALFMLYKMLNVELISRNIKIGSVRPGVVDTEMQNVIREANLEIMPHLQKFHDLFEKDKLEPVDRVTKFLYWILTKTNNEDFVKDEWDIHEEDHIEKWDI